MLHRNIKYIGLLLLMVVLIGGYWLLKSALDIGKPDIKLHQDVGMVGRQSVIEVTFSDRGSSLRDTSISINQGDKTHTLHSVHYPEKGTRDKTISITIDPFNMKMQDGPATLNIKAVDYSLFKNQTLLSRPLTIDMLPPQITSHRSLRSIRKTLLIREGAASPCIAPQSPLSQAAFRLMTVIFPLI